VAYNDQERQKIEIEAHRLVVGRDRDVSSFLEYRNHKIVFRKYASLCFTICIEQDDSELASLEFIHLFVEVLD